MTPPLCWDFGLPGNKGSRKKKCGPVRARHSSWRWECCCVGEKMCSWCVGLGQMEVPFCRCLPYCLRVANGGCRERRWTLCLLCTSAVLMYILLLLELGFFPLFLFSWEKKKKKKTELIILTENFPSFPSKLSLTTNSPWEALDLGGCALFPRIEECWWSN